MSTASIDGQEPQCICGRPQRPKHCPNCGSGFIYAKKANGRWVAAPSNAASQAPVFVPGFTCRRCGIGFADDIPCLAPVKELATSRVERQAEERHGGLGRDRTKNTSVKLDLQDHIAELARQGGYAAPQAEEEALPLVKKDRLLADDNGSLDDMFAPPQGGESDGEK